MKTLQVGEFKAKFSEILKEIQEGEEIVISFGRKKEKVAVIVPYAKYKSKMKPKLGLLEKKASYKIKDTFKITDEESLSS